MSRREIAATIAFVSTEEVKVENLKVSDVVALGRAPYTNWVGSLTENDRAKVTHALALVGMQEFSAKGIDTLSDGERQRVMIARALAQDTPIILLDEPTAFLDLPNKYEIGLLLRRLAHDEGKCIVFSTHDLAIALELCDTIALLEGGRFHYGTTDMLVESIRPGYPQRQAPRRIASLPRRPAPRRGFHICGEIATFAGYKTNNTDKPCSRT